MRALILGNLGMLGQDLVRSAPRYVTVALASEPGLRCDITDPAALSRVFDRSEPDVVINAAGYTAVDRAEDEPDKAFDANARGVACVSRLCADRAIAVVHFSTDYVFSGRSERPYREADVPDPSSVYGKSKLLGEREFAKSGADGLVIRTQWLFGEQGRSFPATMLDRARSRMPTRVVDDQFGRPTYSADLAGWTWELAARRARGIVHAANDGQASWYDVARVIFDREGAGECLRPCRTADYPTRAPRPAYSVLDISKLKTLIGPVPTWEDALTRFLATTSRARSLTP